MPTIHRSPLDDIEIPRIPVTQLVLRHSDRLADKPALVDGPSGRTLTYGELDAQVRALAGGLVERGYGSDRTIAVILPNMPEFAVVFHGIAMAGATLTTINPTYTPDEIRHQLEDAEADTIVTVEMFLDNARDAADGTAVETFVTVDDVEGTESLESWMGDPLDDQVDVDLDQTVVMPYSSGTTGMPKGVMLTHASLSANIAQIIETIDLREDETSVAVLPFFHIYGMQVLMNASLAAGATVVTLPRFDLEQFLTMHEEHAATRTFVAPPMVLALANEPIVDDYDLSSMRQFVSAAAPLGEDLAQEAMDRIDVEIVQGYGMTELSPASHLTPPGQAKLGSVGVTVPNAETRIVDPETMDDLGTDEDGEIWVRGPLTMKGYLKNQEATDETLVDDGWLRTGDIGHIDEDGHLYIVDRLKELIKMKGFQVAPAEMESVLLTHPAVTDSAVIGRPDDDAGEVPIGFVVLDEDAGDVSPQDVKDFVADKVSSYKQLDEVIVLDEIPKSDSGKILRRELADEHI